MSYTLVDILQRVRDERGDLTPRIVVDVAADPAHPLHSHFDWDDKVAGDKWRLEQASQLLRVTYRPDPSRPTDLRAFVAVQGADTHRASYVPTSEAMADPFMRVLVLRNMERDWRSFKARYDTMAEFADLLRREAEGLG
jgi:hypothetical protein